MFKRIITLGLCAVLGYLAALGALEVAAAWGLLPNRETERAAARVREVMLLVNKNSVELDKVGGDALAERAIEGVLTTLDRYSEYLSPEEYRQMNEDIGNAFGGIGVQVEQVEKRVVVVAPIAGSPGERAGILRGDVLAKVDGVSLEGKNLSQVVGVLRGKPGTTVELTVWRKVAGAVGAVDAEGKTAEDGKAEDGERKSEDGDRKTEDGGPKVEGAREAGRELTFKLKREVIKVDSVRDEVLMADGIGYVRLVQFGERTAEEFVRAVEDLQAKGMRALVIDLRNNPGGLLTSAAEVSEVFFERDELVVYTQGRRPEDRVELRAQGKGPRLAVPIAVLINGGSASAAEIVTGALKDTKRAVIVGEKSFGKGSVQTIYPLRGDAGLRLTTARYFTPSGVVIHEKGIEPDIVVVLTPEQEKAVFLHRLRPDVTDAAEFKAKFGVEPAADLQLEAAVRALRERLGIEAEASEGSARATKEAVK